jgi:chemotaxis protein methyltransferase CheR
MVAAGEAGRPWSEPKPLKDAEFRLFQGLVYQKAGIFLSDAKRALLVGRLSRRLRDLGLETFGAYHDYVVKSEGDELATMLDCICTNETHFFREPDHFTFLSTRWVPAMKEAAAKGQAPRRVRVWSAACSTGEEPYSLAMLLLDHLPASEGWELEILATDLSRKVLDKARNGLWSIDKAREIPEDYLKRFMLKGTKSQTGRMKAGDDIQRVIKFERLNLNDDSYAVGAFDLIFCRNVLIYFDAASRSNVVHRLMKHVTPTGYLFLGHAETLTGVTDRLRTVMPTVYTWVDTHARARG